MNELDQLFKQLPGGPMAWLALGVVLLFFGRKVFWLLLAAAGFALGFALGLHLFELQEELPRLAVGMVGGFLGVGLTLVLQKVAVAVAGFLVGGYAVLWLAEPLGYAGSISGVEWIAFVAGGVLVAGVASALFVWALMAVSAVAGALLVVQAFEPPGSLAAVALVALAAVGFLVQARGKLRSR